MTSECLSGLEARERMQGSSQTCTWRSHREQSGFQQWAPDRMLGMQYTLVVAGYCTFSGIWNFVQGFVGRASKLLWRLRRWPRIAKVSDLSVVWESESRFMHQLTGAMYGGTCGDKCSVLWWNMLSYAGGRTSCVCLPPPDYSLRVWLHFVIILHNILQQMRVPY